MKDNIKRATLLTILSVLVVSGIGIKADEMRKEDVSAHTQRSFEPDDTNWEVIEDTKTTSEIYYNYKDLPNESYQIFGVVTDSVSNGEGILITASSFDEDGELDDKVITFFSTSSKFKNSFDSLKIEAGDSVIIKARPNGYVNKINPTMKASDIKKIDFGEEL